MKERLANIYVDLYQVFQEIENYPPEIQEEIESELEIAMNCVKQTINLIEEKP